MLSAVLLLIKNGADIYAYNDMDESVLDVYCQDVVEVDSDSDNDDSDSDGDTTSSYMTDVCRLEHVATIEDAYRREQA